MSIAHNGSFHDDPYYSVDPEALAKAALAFRATPKHTEAPASINTHLTIDGYVCQLTLRDTDETRLLARLHAILAQFPLTPPPADLPPPPARVPQPLLEERPDWCVLHGTAMAKQSNGSGNWFSHKTQGGTWCNGKRRKASA